jgi:hypothetical protein
MENEVKDYLEKFIVGGDAKWPENGSYDYMKLVEALWRSTISDRPDIFSVVDDTIYIFEHFEIDSSPNTKKGSLSRIEINKDNQKFKAAVAGKKDAIFHGELRLKCNSSAYVDNLLNIYKNHYKNIEDYKSNVLKKKDRQKEYKFVITFIIEDKSVFGPLYFDKKGEKKLLLPVFCNEFINEFRNDPNVDNIICSAESSNNQKVTWIVAKEDVDCLANQQVNAIDIILADINPKTIGRSMFIPRKKVKSDK